MDGILAWLDWTKKPQRGTIFYLFILMIDLEETLKKFLFYTGGKIQKEVAQISM